MALRVSSRSVRSSTSASSAASSANRLTRHLDRGHQVGLHERLHEVRHRPGVARPLDEVTLAERGQHHHRRDPLPRDPLRRRDAVEPGHLDVEDHQVGAQRLDQLDGPFSVAGLSDHVVPLLGEHLREVHPDQRLVLRDHDAGSGGRRLGHAGRVSRSTGRCRSGTVWAALAPVVQRQRQWSQTPSSVGSNPTRGTWLVGDVWGGGIPKVSGFFSDARSHDFPIPSPLPNVSSCLRRHACPRKRENGLRSAEHGVVEVAIARKFLDTWGILPLPPHSPSYGLPRRPWVRGGS